MCTHDNHLDDESDAAAATRQWVLVYLDEHEGAMDTAEGIAEWWLPPASSHREVQQVEHVLAGMTAAGLLEEIHAAGRRYYRRPCDASAVHSHSLAMRHS